MSKKALLLVLVLLISLQAEFIREKRKKVVHDTSACLMWQDDNSTKDLKMFYDDAVVYCENLVFAGYDDWRVPNINELISIGDKTKVNPAIKDAFKNVSSSVYWSSTSMMDNYGTPRIIWSFDFNDSNDQVGYRFGVSGFEAGTTPYVDYGESVERDILNIRCVRDKK